MTTIDSYKIKVEGIEVDINIDKEPYKVKYNLSIPEISNTNSVILKEIKKKLILEVSLDPLENTDPKIIKNIKEKFRNSAEKIINNFIPKLNENTKNFIISILIREMLGLGDIEILLEDINLEEVVINSATEPVRVYHKKYGWLETNLTIDSETKIINYANIIARRVGRQITTLNPILDAHLVTGDRSNALLYPISHKGNTITIRKFARDPWTITDFIKNNTCTAEIFALIWLAIQYEMNILISGGTASGKTSFLNVIMPFIPPNHRIISIEDTRELILPKFLYWAPLTVRPPNTEGKGEVCMYPGSFFIDGDGVLHEISNYVEEKLKKGSKKVKENVIIADCDEETVLSGDPLKLGYKRDKIKNVSKILDRKYICDIICEDGTKFSITENTKLPVLNKEGKICLLNPFEIKKLKKCLIPIFTKININAAKQPIKIFEVFDKKDIYVYGIKKEYNLLEKELRINFTTQRLAKICGVKRQAFNYYRKTGILSIQVLKKLLSLSKKYNSEYFEEKIKYLKGRGWNSHLIKVPRIVDEDLAYFAGFVLAEKFLNKNRIILSQKEEISYILKDLTKKLFNLDIKIKKEKYNKYYLFSPVISHLMNKLFNADKANKIRVSRAIMKSPENIISAFLAGYIDGDGSVDHGRVTLSTINKQAVNEFKYLFNRLGIISSIYNGGKTGFSKHNCYALNITSRISVKKACSLLKFRKIDKIHRAKNNLDTYFDESIKKDRLPFSLIKNYIENLKKYLNKNEKFKYYYRYTENKESTISKRRITSLITLVAARLNTTQEERDSLQTLTEINNQDIEYIKVKCVRIRKNKNNIPSYDLTPEKFKYFLAGTGNFTFVEDTMLDLLVNSLRMRPDRIIMGEIRKADQAEVLFEAMHTGHSVYATVHADSISETIKRLTNPPINVPQNLLTAVNLNVVMFRDRRLGIRRVSQVGEYLVGEGEEETRPNILYRWKPLEDQIVPHASSVRLFDELSTHTGMSLQEIEQDLNDKKKILNWMVKNNKRKLDEVGEIIYKYYSNPKDIFKK
ncbi:Flp pilus assembly complex ATPase component TadA [Candidatus Woesearchaeota archaeon]|nr:Flp pilus assembly complex ATPase component TadA [Candidatus Woesearchaeota archaeon]